MKPGEVFRVTVLVFAIMTALFVPSGNSRQVQAQRAAPLEVLPQIETQPLEAVAGPLSPAKRAWTQSGPAWQADAS
mgnify:CR=1 FL=1